MRLLYFFSITLVGIVAGILYRDEYHSSELMLFFVHTYILPFSDSISSSVMQFLFDILTRDSLKWRLKLLRSASLYANSRVHSVKVQTLILARFFFLL